MDTTFFQLATYFVYAWLAVGVASLAVRVGHMLVDDRTWRARGASLVAFLLALIPAALTGPFHSVATVRVVRLFRAHRQAQKDLEAAFAAFRAELNANIAAIPTGGKIDPVDSTPAETFGGLSGALTAMHEERRDARVAPVGVGSVQQRKVKRAGGAKKPKGRK